jgi:CTP-dependent riboflavin kinase
MAVRITGKIIRGEGNAGKNNSVLIPLLVAHFPEIANCSQFGTINIQLDQPLDRSRADVWTRRVVWNPVQLLLKERRIEAFGFIKIKFECPLRGPAYDCWIILPEGSGLTYCDDKVEIVADVFIQGVEYGVDCAIDIDHVPSITAPSSFGALYGRSLPVVKNPI